MENEKNKNVVLLVVFIVLSLLLAGFIIYDKVLNKSTSECPKCNCQCEKCEVCKKCEEKSENLDEDYYHDLISGVKYKNLSRPDNYIQFNVGNKTWKAARNSCHGYEDISGTYTIEKNEIILKGDFFEGGKNVFTMVSGNYSGDIILIYDKDGDVEGCSEQNYFVSETFHH